MVYKQLVKNDENNFFRISYNKSTVELIIFNLSRFAFKSVESFKTCEFSKNSYLRLRLFITFAKKNRKTIWRNYFSREKLSFWLQVIELWDQNLFRADFRNSDP